MDSIKRGLYIHIPFCRRKCPYCDFFSVDGSSDQINNFCNSLINQINNYQKKVVLSSIYFGGGTPSLLSGKNLEDIFDVLKRKFVFDDGIETTIELNPDDVEQMDLILLKKLGINRISLGLQSCNDKELSMLGRRHDVQKAIKAYGMLRRVFDNISVDLMFCLPGQTVSSLDATLEKVAELNPEHVSAYILKIFDNTPFGKTYREMDDDLSADMYLHLCSFFEERGYSHYEISSFCRDGNYSRHNMLYWSGGEYIGFGPGAHGYEDDIRYMYEPDLSKYIYYKGNPSPVVLEKLSPEEKKKEKIIFGLRTKTGIPFGLLDSERNQIVVKLIKEGLCTKEKDRIVLTDRGMLLSNSVISELI